jgi:hypothetical protein
MGLPSVVWDSLRSYVTRCARMGLTLFAVCFLTCCARIGLTLFAILTRCVRCWAHFVRCLFFDLLRSLLGLLCSLFWAPFGCVCWFGMVIFGSFYGNRG